MIEITTLDELNQLKSEKEKVILNFYTDWDLPSKVAAPYFKRLAKDNINITFVKVNYNKGHEICDEYDIFGMPIFMSFFNGEIKDIKQGFSKKELKSMVFNLK